MFRLIRHEGEAIVVAHANQHHTLTRCIRSYTKRGPLLTDEEVQRWHFDDFTAVRISRPILKYTERPVGSWAVNPGSMG